MRAGDRRQRTLDRPDDLADLNLVVGNFGWGTGALSLDAIGRWPIATFRGDAAIQSLSERSGHSPLTD